MARSVPMLIASNVYTLRNGVIYLSEPDTFSKFESQYIQIRQVEGRIYSDKVVSELPRIDPTHLHSEEWQIRRMSLNKLISYLNKKKKPGAILDLGCGTGWMSDKIAQLEQYQVYGVDINHTELEQGGRVFSNTINLHLIYADIYHNIFKPASFDHIILASSIQYFPDLKSLLKELQKLLKSGGRIHIIDSPLYTNKSVYKAKRRTLNYFQKIGHEEMSDYYYHHVWEALNGFPFRIKYRHLKLFNLFKKKIDSPFPWIIIHPLK